MSTKERRQRQVAERERLFLDKTRELICSEGLLQVQMARIAEACDYSTGTLYQHFASKEDLLVALLTDRAQQRIDLFRRAASWDACTRDRMFAFCVAESVFVTRNPEYFRLEQFALTEVIWSCASPARQRKCLETLAPISELALGIVHDAVEQGDLELGGSAPEEVTFGLWTMVAGTHSLAHTQGLLEFVEIDEPYRMLGRNMHRLLNGLGWKPLVDISLASDIEAQRTKELSLLFGELCGNSSGQSTRKAS